MRSRRRRRRGARLRAGVTELMSATILILMAVLIGTAFYLMAKTIIDQNTKRILTALERAEAEIGSYIIVDAFYISTNHTLVIYLYTTSNYPAIFDTMYINSTKVPPSSYVDGFGKPVRVGMLNRFAAIVTLNEGGTYEIMLTGRHGVKAITTLHIAS